MKNFWTDSLIKDEKGAAAISCMIIVCVLSMLSVYVYDLTDSQTKSLAVFKAAAAAKDFSLSRAEAALGRYERDTDAWRDDMERAEKSYAFSDSIIVDEAAEKDEYFGEKTAKVYLMRSENGAYILVAESAVNGIVNQICVYLEQKDDELIVQRWER